MTQEEIKTKKGFIEIMDGVEIRPQLVARKSKVVYKGKYIYSIKVLGDREYEVTEEIFNQIQ